MLNDPSTLNEGGEFKIVGELSDKKLQGARLVAFKERLEAKLERAKMAAINARAPSQVITHFKIAQEDRAKGSGDDGFDGRVLINGAMFFKLGLEHLLNSGICGFNHTYSQLRKKMLEAKILDGVDFAECFKNQPEHDEEEQDDEREEEEKTEAERHQEVQEMNAVNLFSEFEPLVKDLYFRELAAQEGRLAEYYTEFLIRDLDKYHETLIAGGGVAAVSGNIATVPFIVEQHMYVYLVTKVVENPASPSFPYTDFGNWLSLNHIIYAEMGMLEIHHGAMFVALDSLLANAPDAVETGGSPKELLSRIEDGEVLALDFKKFKELYTSIVNQRIGHAGIATYEKKYKRAEELVRERYPEIDSILTERAAALPDGALLRS